MPIIVEAGQFNCGLVWDMACRPNLAVGVRIGTTHHSAFIFKYLDIIDEIEFPQFNRLFCPGADNVLYLLLGEFR